MDAIQQELYERFRSVFKSHVEYRRQQAQELVTKDWVLDCYDAPDIFVREVELNFPTWSAFGDWLEGINERDKERNVWMKKELKRLGREGLGYLEREWLRYEVPTPDGLDEKKDRKNGRGLS